MTGSMYAAVAGLGAHMNALNVIGNNVANVNTNAYKATRYVFKEELYTMVRSGSDGTSQTGGVNPGQIGYGCSVGTVDIDMSTKNYDATGRPMDVLIDGDGFLLVGDKGETFRDIGDVKKLKLTRLCDLKFDSQGYLTDGNGNVVYGFMNAITGENDAEATPSLVPVLTAIRLPMLDTAGNAVYATANNGTPPSVDDATTSPYTNPDGGELTIAKDENGNNVRVQLDSIGISESGVITGITKAGDVVTVGVIAIGQVDNPNGVTHVDGHYYKALDGSGNLSVTTAGAVVTHTVPADGNVGGNDNLLASNFNITSAGETVLRNNGLETSGTNLAKEITNMIMMQRGYQANTRIITVTDSMLEELVNMKR